MDGQRFDDLTRRLLAATTRRRVLAAAAGLLGGVAIAGEAAADVSRAGRCRPARVGCTRDSQCCSGTCETGRGLPRSRRNRCLCTPDCTDKVCGDDGCGGSCGSCWHGKVCEAGVCLSPYACETYDASGADTGHLCMSSVDPGGDVLSVPGFCSWVPRPSDGAECASDADCQEALDGFSPALIGICNDGYRDCRNPGPSCADYVPYGGSQFCTYFVPYGVDCPTPPA